MKHWQNDNTQSGFTLVELAIVMIIIGLLIGGVLKGQELIKNAELTAVVQKIHPWEVAVASFRVTYGTIPGDLRNASTRLPDCTGDCAAAAGNGNKHLEGGATSYGFPYRYLPTYENQLFWWQLAAAGLLDDVSAAGTDGGTITPAWGVTSPASPHDDSTGFGVFEANVAPVAGLSALRGIVLHLGRHCVSSDWCDWRSSGGGGGAFTPRDMHSIDAKMDDGIPGTGRVRSIAWAGGASDCVFGLPYNDNSAVGTDCNAIFKISN